MKLVIALLFAASVAHADPETHFVELGATAGATHEGEISAGLTASGGYRVSDLWWLHATAASSTAPILHSGWSPDPYNGKGDRITDLRGGVELKPCTANGIWCGVVGVDLGYRHETFQDRSSPEAVARFGLDISAKYVRIRPVIEGTTTHAGDSAAFVFGVAYAW